MSIHKIESFSLTCDHCGETLITHHDGFSIFSDEDQAHEAADNEGWYCEEGRDGEDDHYYCKECHWIDDKDEMHLRMDRRNLNRGKGYAPTPSPKDQPEGPYTLRWVSKTPDDGSENIVVRRKGSPYRAVVDRVGVALKDGYENTWGYVTDSEIEYLEETSSPAVQPVGVFDPEEFWARHKRNFTGVNAGEFMDKEDYEKALHLYAVELKYTASEAGMSQEDFERKTKNKDK